MKFLFFFQLFKTDIEYLLSMEKLWQTRTPPVPLELGSLFTDQGTSGYSMHTCTVYVVYSVVYSGHVSNLLIKNSVC